MIDMQILIKLKNRTFGRRAGSHIISTTSTSCPDSSIYKKGGDVAKINI
jgi:hypothetical protein